eukprot:3975165-Pyramimonas_sp.AAC.1
MRSSTEGPNGGPAPLRRTPQHVSRPHRGFRLKPQWQRPHGSPVPYRHTLRLHHGPMRRSPEGDTRNDGTHNCK